MKTNGPVGGYATPVGPLFLKKDESMKKTIDFIPVGTCCHNIRLTMSDDIVESVSFSGGCHGNLQGISVLVRGMKAKDVIEKLNGIRCGAKSTSCPDQLCRAIEAARRVLTDSPQG